MSSKIPFLFVRYRKCTAENGLISNCNNGKERAVYVVKYARCYDYTYYNSAWMDDELLTRVNNNNNDYTLVPDVDITEEAFVFDMDNAAEAEKIAFTKMKELWSLYES